MCYSAAMTSVPPTGDDRAAMAVALISDVFFDESGAERLGERLAAAREAGADLAVLPELPCNPWSPATMTACEDDAEPPGGPRHRMQAAAAAEAGIGLVGGAIVRDPATGVRRNTALVFDKRGELVATYAKVHLPQEPGFWEPCHYEAGDEPPGVIDGFSMRLGVQICSDVNRPVGTHLLGALGAEAVLAPRATEAVKYEKWRPVFVANALTGGLYVLSVNRPEPEQGVALGGPSIAVGPDGRVLAETTEPVAVVTLERSTVEAARGAYPGHLAVRSDLYARWWRDAPARVLPDLPVSAGGM